MKGMLMDCKLKLKEKWIPILALEIVFLFSISYIILPFYSWLIGYIFKFNGVSFVVDSNVMTTVRKPWAIITFIILFLFLGFLFLLEEITIILLAKTSYRLTFRQWKQSVKKIFSITGFFFVIVSFFISLVFHPFYFFLLNQNFRYTEQLLKEGYRYGLVSIIFFTLLVFLMGILMLLIKYEFFINDQSIIDSIKNVRNRLKEKFISISFTMILYHTITLVFFAIFYLILMFILFLLLKDSDYYSLRYASWLTVMNLVNKVIVYFYTVIALTINFIIVTVASYNDNAELDKLIREEDYNQLKGKRFSKKTLYFYFILISFMVLYVLTNRNFLKGTRLQLGFDVIFEKPEIVAHRGNSSVAPENTLISVQSAIDALADRTEIDVQLSKDNIPVLMHDTTLKRTCNINGKVSDYYFEDLINMDAGIWYSKRFANEKIPSLEDVISLSKDKINLMIELKATKGREDLYATAVIDLIHKYEVAQQVIVASFSLDMLEEIKKLDKGIVTCLITRVAYGPLYKHEAIDIVSINSSFAGSRTLESFDNTGYPLYVWTVNNKREITNMKDLKVSGIITDYPIEARKQLYQDSVPSFIGQLVDNYFRIFR